MRRRPPRATRTDTLFPYTTLFRSLVPAAEQGESFAYALSKQTPTPPSAVKQGRVPGRGELPPPEGRMPPSADSIRSDVSYRPFQPTMGRKSCRTSLPSDSTFSVARIPAPVITNHRKQPVEVKRLPFRV